MAVKRLKTKKTQAYLSRLASFLFVHTNLVLFLFVVLTILLGRFALKLEHQTTLRDLLPADNEVVRRFEETVTTFDLVDRVVVVLKFNPENLELAQAFAEIFVEQALAQAEAEEYLHWLRANLYAQNNQTNWNEYLQFITRLLPTDRIPELAQRLHREGIFAQVEENRRELESGLTAKVLIEKDPLNLLGFAAPYSNEIRGNYQINFTDGFLVSKDRDMLLILGKPIQSPENVEFSKALDNFLTTNIEEAKKVFSEEEGLAPEELFEIGLTGPHPITAEENRIITGDVVNMFVSSFATVLFLFILAYGRPLALFYVGIPLLSAEIWTLGLGYLLFGRLNLLTAAFSAVIVGLGIDYAIHIFSRYLDERNHGNDPLQSMKKSLVQTGLGTAIGGVTTALAFSAMAASNFTGLREFGTIAAIGIILCLLQMFVFLPCLLFLRERWQKNSGHHPKAQWDFHVEKLLTAALGHKRIAIVLFLLATILMGYQAIQLRFNTDIRSVRARSNASIKLQNEVTAKVGGSLRSLTFVLEAETEEGLYRLHEQMLPELQRLRQEEKLVRFDSLLVVLQSPENQAINQEMLTRDGLDGATVKRDFYEAMDRFQLRVTEDSRDYIENLAIGLDAKEPLSLKRLVDMNSNFIRPFLNYDDGKFKTVVHVYPRKGLWEKDAVRSLETTLIDAVEPSRKNAVFVTGIQTISNELKDLIRDSFKVSTFLAAALVLLILYLHFRKFTLVALTLTPLVVSVIWMLGTMRLLGIDITVLNFVATPLIIGIGIDDGVHIVEKYLHRTSTEIGKLIAACGKAVTLTSLTTIFGFSSLFIADYSGFRSLGLCAILGVFFCWVGSVLLLPLLMDLFKIKFVRSDLPGH